MIYNGIDYQLLQDHMDVLKVHMDKEELNVAMNDVHDILRQHPHDPLATVYMGIYLLLETRTTYNLLTKKKLVDRGLAIIDGVNSAQYQHQKDLYVRLMILEGTINVQMPTSFKRTQKGIDQLLAAKNSPLFPTLHADDKGKIYANLSIGYKKLGNASLASNYAKQAEKYQDTIMVKEVMP